jgi:predicted amidohydrolase
MKIAAAQIVTTLDKSENRELAVQIVKEAAGAGADLVVLPEATMCSFGDDDTPLTEYAEPLYGPFVKALTRVAGETGITVIAGIFEPATGEDRVYNTIVAVGPAGHIGAYRKFHLYDAMGWKESRRIKPGDPTTDEMVVFSIGELTVGVMNCYDLRFPEMARALVDRGANVLVVPAHFINGPEKAEVWQVLLRARAIENTAYVVGAGKPGPECTGHSMIVDPLGDVLADLDGDEIGAVGAELSIDRVREVRVSIPVLENRRFSVRAKS